MVEISQPQRIERLGETALKVTWADGHESIYTWEFLRASCPCAACRENKLPQSYAGVTPLEIQPVGRYALTIRWSDGHATGIFSHQFLRSICSCEACKPSQMDEG